MPLTSLFINKGSIFDVDPSTKTQARLFIFGGPIVRIVNVASAPLDAFFGKYY